MMRNICYSEGPRLIPKLCNCFDCFTVKTVVLKLELARSWWFQILLWQKDIDKYHYTICLAEIVKILQIWLQKLPEFFQRRRCRRLDQPLSTDEPGCRRETVYSILKTKWGTKRLDVKRKFEPGKPRLNELLCQCDQVAKLFGYLQHWKLVQ